MKKLFLSFFLLCFAYVQATAAEWTDENGVTWTFNTSTNSWYYGGSYHYFYTIIGVSGYGDEVTIPSVVYDGETPYTIGVISSSVFRDNKTLTTVTLPSSIKVINSSAFYGCSSLTTINLADVEYVSNNVFQSCTSLTAVDLSSCQYIGQRAFYGCSNVETINLPLVETIGYYVFSGCTSLTEVALPKAMSLGEQAFSGCSNVETLSLPLVETIGSSAFQNCTSLTEVALPKATSLGGNAFYGCSNVETLSLPLVETIGSSAFFGCTSLTEVALPKATSLGVQAFYGCSNVETISLPLVETIGNNAFNGCTSLTEVALPKATSLGSFAFYGCSNVETISLPLVETIGYSAFNGCTSLTEVALPKATSLGEEAFSGCSNVETLSLPLLETIGGNAFWHCTSLTEVDLPKATSLGSFAFSGCSNVETISLPLLETIGEYAFQSCTSLTEVALPKATSLGSYAFSGCSNVETISLPLVETIGNNAFNGCISLDAPEITSTALTYIGNYAFSTPGTITLMATTPATLGSNNAFGSQMVVRVPDAALATYRAADVWSDFNARIIGIGTTINYDVDVTALNDRSILEAEIGEANLGNVVSLKITGSINGYDIMVMRNKMDNLHYLDLSDANIVANNYSYITGHHTEDNVMPEYGFQNMQKLVSVKLPKSITSIGSGAFQGCNNLKDVVFQTGIESIGYSAFESCRNLRKIDLKAGLKTIGDCAFGGSSTISGQPQEEEVIIPDGVETIGGYAFGNNRSLKRIALPSSLKTIGRGVFEYCSALQNVSLPTSLEIIPEEAFKNCGSLTEVRIPSTILRIANRAFWSCSKLNDVYTYIVEPTEINMETFSTYTTATLHVPSTSYYNYWYDTEWSQFRYLEEFEAIYQYFYINNDFTINDDQGTISGDVDEDDPNADLNPGSGLIIETDETNPQILNEVHIKMKGSDVASVITASNFEANNVYFDIDIKAGRWYFLSFPFNVKTTNVTAPGTYTFRTYDPEERADGKTGWQTWIGDLLYKGQGYIFHCSKGGTLTLCVEKEDMDWDAETRSNALTSAPSENAQDASWNFIGNPQTSYYDIDATGYDQPITVWNGSGYEAVRPGDDSYALQPFEAFFVQKPNDKNEMDFPADGRYTQNQWEEAQQTKAAARRTEGVSRTRQIVNLVLTNGLKEDKTRVVFNEEKSKDYEIECDAAKFMSSEKIPQLYTIDQMQSRYAINERPTGEVRLGYKATENGELTIKAMRMDQPMMLHDTKLQITHDLSMGDYTFATEAGTNESRFILVVDNSATNVGKLRQETGVSVMAEEGGISFLGISEEPVNVYSVGGVLMAGNVHNGFLSLPKASYLVKVGNATAKVIVR